MYTIDLGFQHFHLGCQQYLHLSRPFLQRHLSNANEIVIRKRVPLKTTNDLVEHRGCNFLNFDVRYPGYGFLPAWAMDHPWLDNTRLDSVVGVSCKVKDLTFSVALGNAESRFNVSMKLILCRPRDNWNWSSKAEAHNSPASACRA